MIWVTTAEYVGGYCLRLGFNDGKTGEIDLTELIMNDSREVFRQLRDQRRFRQFEVKMDTVVWANGLDLAPEFLYDNLVCPADRSTPEHAVLDHNP
jgi:hypothetical protein